MGDASVLVEQYISSDTSNTVRNLDKGLSVTPERETNMLPDLGATWTSKGHTAERAAAASW